jgi:hypothetical protein
MKESAMATKRTSPAGATKRNEAEGAADVEAHAIRRSAKARATAPIEEPGAGPAGARRAGPEGEDDVEGHNFGQNAMLSRNAAQSREREVQRNLKQHDLKGEARRPFLKGR